MTKTARLMAPVIAAAAIALTAAPAAQATTNCRDSGGAKVCQRPGHTSLHTSPKVRGPAGGLFGSAWLPGYGRGQLPPMIALD